MSSQDSFGTSAADVTDKRLLTLKSDTSYFTLPEDLQQRFVDAVRGHTTMGTGSCTRSPAEISWRTQQSLIYDTRDRHSQPMLLNIQHGICPCSTNPLLSRVTSYAITNSDLDQGFLAPGRQSILRSHQQDRIEIADELFKSEHLKFLSNPDKPRTQAYTPLRSAMSVSGSS